MELGIDDSVGISVGTVSVAVEYVLSGAKVVFLPKAKYKPNAATKVAILNTNDFLNIYNLFVIIITINYIHSKLNTSVCQLERMKLTQV